MAHAPACRTLPSSLGAQLDPTLATFLRRAAIDSEVAAARVRRVVMPLFALRLVVAQFTELMAGVPKHFLSLGCIAVGLGLSEFLLLRLQESKTTQTWLTASVLLDVTVAFGVCLLGVVWPADSFPGFLSRTDWAVFPILAVAGGLRLSRIVSAIGAIGATLSMAVLIAVDASMNSQISVYEPADVLLGMVFMLVSAMLGDAYATRVRRLVTEGAGQAVQAERAKHRLGAYVSEEVAALALLDDEAHLGGEEKDVAVLFSDLRGFTTYGEGLSPDALVTELNDYLEDLVPAIRNEGGVVDKYIGDAIMAVFGVPESTGDEAARAIRAAAAMHKALVLHNERRAGKGLPPLQQGIGAHFGRVVAGHVGTKERLQYTVVGDTVNVASRLEGATKTEGVPILFSDALVQQATAEGASLPLLQVHGEVAIRGRIGAQRVHTLAQPET